MQPVSKPKRPGDQLPPEPDELVEALAGSLGAIMAEPEEEGAIAEPDAAGAMLASGFIAGAVAAGAGAADSGAF